MFKLFGKKTDKNEESPLENDALLKRLKAIIEINHMMAGVTNQEEILELVTTKLLSLLGVSYASTWLLDEQKQVLKLAYLNVPKSVSRVMERFLGKSINDTQYDINNPEHRKNYTVATFLEGKMLETKKLFDAGYPLINESSANIVQSLLNIKFVLHVPLIANNNKFGVLGLIWNTEVLTQADRELVITFGDQISTAIYNARLFSQVQLQVDQLTLRNKELQSLYNLTSQVSKSLDLSTVAQTAVDSLPQDQNMLGGIISEYNEKEGTLRVLASTRNQISYQAEKIVGSFNQYITNINDPGAQQNIGIRTIKEGQMYYTNNLSDYLHPALPKALIPPIEALLNIKSVIVHPLRSRDNIIGVIAYFLRERSYESLSDNEKQLYQTYTYQIAIALDNAELYKQQKQTQANLEKALQQVQALRQHEQDMIDIMGHELRTPISIVRNSLSMLELEIKTKGELPKDHLEKYLSIALESARRESKLVETLLSSAKADSRGFQLLFEQVDLIDVVDDSLEFFKREAEKKGLQIQYDRPTERIDVYCDRTRIQEVVDNFLSNAVKYTEQGFIKIKIYKDEGYGRVDVTDTGIGISQEDLASLGKKFYRVDQYGEKGMTSHPDKPDIIRPGGTGLGLYVTFNLIKIMDGKLNVESKLNTGSTFSFSMPLFNGQERKQEQRKVASEFDKS